jgi:hypothetical protein
VCALHLSLTIDVRRKPQFWGQLVFELRASGCKTRKTA